MVIFDARPVNDSIVVQVDLYMRWIALVALSVALPTQAQDYFEGDPRWQVRFSCYWNGCASADSYEYWLSGDSVINGVLWHRVLRQGQVDLNWVDGPFNPDCQGSTPYGTEAHPPILVRQEGRTMRIWISGTDLLLHDFDLVVGQELTSSWTSTYGHVTAVDSVLIGSTMRARYTTSLWQTEVIEGVGSNRGLVEAYERWDECGSLMTCYGVEGAGYYPTPGVDCALSTSVANITSEAFTLWPNPATNSLFVRSDRSLGLLRILDAKGVLVYSTNLNSARMANMDLGGLSSGVYSVHLVDRPAQRLIILD